jgi:hypothetical protein
MTSTGSIPDEEAAFGSDRGIEEKAGICKV